VEWQLFTVGMLVLAAAWYLGRQTWRSWRGNKSACGGGCACASKGEATGTGQNALITGDQLTARLRRGP
jgi:hypothetical protein